MSSGSPKMSESTTESTRAGAQCAAKRPPLTAERRLRTVFISTILAPLFKSCWVISCNSCAGSSGDSNSALPPPESRNKTQSSARRPAVISSARAVAANVSASGTGWPAS